MNLPVCTDDISKSLSEVSNTDLLTSIKGLKGNENRAIADIVLRLFEINSRGIYRDAGYSSMHEYCTRALGYSSGAAYRRLEAAKALKTSPEVYELLLTGKIALA